MWDTFDCLPDSHSLSSLLAKPQLYSECQWAPHPPPQRTTSDWSMPVIEVHSFFPGNTGDLNGQWYLRWNSGKGFLSLKRESTKRRNSPPPHACPWFLGWYFGKAWFLECGSHLTTMWEDSADLPINSEEKDAQSLGPCWPSSAAPLLEPPTSKLSVTWNN